MLVSNAQFTTQKIDVVPDRLKRSGLSAKPGVLPFEKKCDGCHRCIKNVRTTPIRSCSAAIVCAYFSVRGMVVLFPGAPTAVVSMAVTMEAAKLITAGWLARQTPGAAKSRPRLPPVV